MDEIETRHFGQVPDTFLSELVEVGLNEFKRVISTMSYPPGKYRTYEDKLIAICLLQGVAQHIIDIGQETVFDNRVDLTDEDIRCKGYKVLENGRVVSGIKDVDLCLFFRASQPPLPRKHKAILYEFSGLGYRRVDLIKAGIGEGILTQASTGKRADIIRAYMKHARRGIDYWSRKSAVGIYPIEIHGQRIWKTECWHLPKTSS
jgi:hypothetical protein